MGRVCPTAAVIISILLPVFIQGSWGQDLYAMVSLAPVAGNIRIEGDDDFSTSNGVSSGTGTITDPYVIENRTIDCGPSHGILIANTTKHLLIRKCTIFNGSHDN
ncbi:MAG: hypothetical protein ACMUHY_08840, partial [Thermoplasmatota archaeon]